MDGVRIDKWLWAARFYKTRSLAARACELGRVLYRDQPVKPAREVHPGDKLLVKNESGDFRIEVLQLSEMRGPAPVARALYQETDADRDLRIKQSQERREMARLDPFADAKPSKRDRRDLDRLRGR
jgi:ribosome-associated heat shock protein Hsp15